MQVIEQVSGGIRFGAFNEVGVELVAKTADDATTLAAHGKWLPGLVQLDNSFSPPSRLADAVENLQVSSRSNVVSLTFTLPSERILKIVKADKSTIVE